MGSRYAVRKREVRRLWVPQAFWVPHSFAFFAKRWERCCRRRYSFPFNPFTIPRIAFSLRRYQRHWPFLVASTSPAFVRIAIW